MVAGCGAKTGKVILVIVNTIFVLLGLGLAIAGLVFKFGSDVFEDDIKKVLEKINLTVVNGIDVYSLANSLSVFFIILGFIILALGLLGCCGACCEWRPVLVIYAILVGLILIAQITAIALFAAFKGDIDDTMEKGFREVFMEYPTNNETREELKAMFTTFECCGVTGASDFKNFTGSYRTPPPQCCGKSTGTCGANEYYKGCFSKFSDLFSTYNAAFIGVGVSVLIFQFLCVVFACCLCCGIGREDGNHV